ncbi:FAD-dependent oxidoreductase [Marinicrinis lubricantis]|uniref:FAD-dependent oxidoreductase n=1 Tax=Marinicrinis lubricantis TaxID=2086470 RepID=A0ABW1ISC7_9BACL
MYDIAIIGAGPAGASAAIFTAKAGKKTVVFDHDKGMTKRAWFENFYGIQETNGPDLIETGIRQLKRLGAEFISEEAADVKKQADGFMVTTASGQTYEAKHIIFATGLSVELAEKLGVETTEGTEPRIKTVIKADSQGRTNVDNAWAAGTVAGVSVHGIITAGDGGKVAINVISELNGERYVDHDLYQPK